MLQIVVLGVASLKHGEPDGWYMSMMANHNHKMIHNMNLLSHILLMVVSATTNVYVGGVVAAVGGAKFPSLRGDGLLVS
eukprot:2673298-Amphidinium_carterae.1